MLLYTGNLRECSRIKMLIKNAYNDYVNRNNRIYYEGQEMIAVSEIISKIANELKKRKIYFNQSSLSSATLDKIRGKYKRIKIKTDRKYPQAFIKKDYAAEIEKTVLKKYYKNLKKRKENEEIMLKGYYEPIFDTPNLALPAITRQKSVDYNVLGTGLEAIIASPFREQEKDYFFRALNFHKHMIFKIKEKLKRIKKNKKEKQLLENNLDNHEYNLKKIKDEIFAANTLLLISATKNSFFFYKYKHGDKVDIASLYSKGQEYLNKTIDRFDYRKGFEFSTYAYKQLISAFQKAARQSDIISVPIVYPYARRRLEKGKRNKRRNKSLERLEDLTRKKSQLQLCFL